MLVILPEGEENEEAVQELLHPFYEDLEFEEYTKKCYCIGDIAKEIISQMLSEANNFLAEVYREKVKEKGYRPYRDELTSLFHEIKDPFISLSQHMLSLHPDRNKPTPDCDCCKGKGEYTTTANPQGYWDWYEIGGRWSSYLIKKQSPTGYVAIADVFEICSAWFNRYQAASHDFRKLSEEDKTCPFPFGLVTPNGDWLSRGVMGWWGMVHDEENRKVFCPKMLEQFDRYREHTAAICDLHI